MDHRITKKSLCFCGAAAPAKAMLCGVMNLKIGIKNIPMGESKWIKQNFKSLAINVPKGCQTKLIRSWKMAKGEKFCAIGLITTDDFYGCYLTWAYSNNIDEYFEWENGAHPDFLYDPLVDIIEADEEIDFEAIIR